MGCSLSLVSASFNVKDHSGGFLDLSVQKGHLATGKHILNRGADADIEADCSSRAVEPMDRCCFITAHAFAGKVNM
jgi:hypothetical protein